MYLSTIYQLLNDGIQLKEVSNQAPNRVSTLSAGTYVSDCNSTGPAPA